jgi:hypothetical protein
MFIKYLWKIFEFLDVLEIMQVFLIYTISGIKAILQDSSVKFADDEGVSPSFL